MSSSSSSLRSKFPNYSRLLQGLERKHERNPKQQQLLKRGKDLQRQTISHLTRQKVKFNFHLEIEGIIPCFILSMAIYKLQDHGCIHQTTYENTGVIENNTQIPNPGTVRKVYDFGLLYHNSGDNTLSLTFSNSIKQQQKRYYQSIFSKETLTANLNNQIDKAYRQNRQISGDKERRFAETVSLFVLRHIDPEKILDNTCYFQISTLYGPRLDSHAFYSPDFIRPYNPNTSHGPPYMSLGKIRLKLGFNTITEVMSWIERFRYDYMTFYPPFGNSEKSKIRVSFRDPLDYRPTFKPLIVVSDRSWISSDYSMLLAYYVQSTQKINHIPSDQEDQEDQEDQKPHQRSSFYQRWIGGGGGGGGIPRQRSSRYGSASTIVGPQQRKS